MGEKEKQETYDEQTDEQEEVEILDASIADDQEVEEVEVITEDDITSLKTENEQLKAEVDEMKERMLRVQAEYDNYRKRSEKERIAARKYESEALATALLQVIDNFDRALQTEVDESAKGFYDGVKMVYGQFIQALNDQGVEAMEVENEPFDPNLHHAVMQEEDDSKESNIVIEELQKGYMLKDKVIRPAMVKVNK